MNKGFTIIELLVVILLFGVLMVTSTSVFINVFQNSNRASVQNEVRQNAGKIMQDLSAEIRKASCVYVHTEPSPGAELRLSDSTIDPTCIVGNRVEYYQDSNGTLTKAATNSANNPVSFAGLSAQKVAVLNCSVNSGSCGGACIPGLVITQSGNAYQVNLSVQQALGIIRSDYCAAVNLIDTIAPRSY